MVILTNLTNLLSLVLKENYIEELKSKFFRDITNVVYFVVNKNSLTQVPTDVLKFLRELVHLNLNQNLIPYISAYAFQNNSKL